MRPNLYGIGRPASNQYTAWCGAAGASFPRLPSAPLGAARSRAGRPRRHSGVLASIVIPFSARLGKLKCRNSWGNIGFLPKKNILLRHCNDALDIMEYFQSIIQFGRVPSNGCNRESAPPLGRLPMDRGVAVAPSIFCVGVISLLCLMELLFHY